MLSGLCIAAKYVQLEETAREHIRKCAECGRVAVALSKKTLLSLEGEEGKYCKYSHRRP